MAFVAFAGGMFFVASLVRAYFVFNAQQVKDSGVARSKLFKRRLVHSLIILLTLAYLQLCIRMIEGVACEAGADGSKR